jgi:hypothetical protein
MEVLQTSALPLGYPAFYTLEIPVANFSWIARKSKGHAGSFSIFFHEIP